MHNPPHPGEFVRAAGAGVTYADRNYMNTYFGVTPADSQASGLAPFSAGAGVRDARVWLVGMLHLSPRWHLGAGRDGNLQRTWWQLFEKPCEIRPDRGILELRKKLT